ncbi:hypothetical protein [Bradyrhizobium sp. BR13661]|jgi:hypothetical protein|uniref:hypothetical protein n=1 Tax=Bradyrhizobium sp. BR13661 TaxID=2940622 RepID=UPI0024758B1D|nr:hypothetical protein [Bradyrhizobium sp. BR13661]MDH6263357.1 hypothetical protein [Bradyrhizobium sp. BR13661]
MKSESSKLNNSESQDSDAKNAAVARSSNSSYQDAASDNEDHAEGASNKVTVFTQTPAERLNREVDFALMLADLIRVVKRDPEQLRLTIYDFARVKLANELTWATPSERESLLHSLEVAIHGVEKFSLRSEQVTALPAANAISSPEVAAYFDQEARFRTDIPETKPAPVHLVELEAIPQRRKIFSPRGIAVASILLLFIFGGFLAGSMVLGSVFLMRDKLVQAVAPTSSEKVVQQTIESQLKGVPTPPPPPAFPIPGDYGVYALNNGALEELEVLSEQVPDKRIAMSTPIMQPSRIILPDGRAKFIVYRRDLANNAPERVDVRVVAQVTRAHMFDAKGKPTTAPVSGAWNIRNITFAFRVRPLPGNAEMLLIQPESADFSLKPGRYVLVLKSQGYDFTIAGRITDPAQCLERTEAANGVFYSECEKT